MGDSGTATELLSSASGERKEQGNSGTATELREVQGMQAFEVHWYQWMWVMVLTGVAVFVFIYLGFYLPSLPGRPPGREAPREPFPAGIEAAARGIPPVLWLLFIGFAVYAVLYTLYMWLGGIAY